MQNASSENKFMNAVSLASDFGLYVSIAAVFILSAASDILMGLYNILW
jgi:hypothetical protein